MAPLLDHVVGAGDQDRRDIEAQSLRSLEVDDQRELAGSLDRQLARLGPFWNAVNVSPRPPEQVSQIGAIRHQRARRWKESEETDRRQTDLQSQTGNLLSLR